MSDAERLRRLDFWLAVARLVSVPLAAALVLLSEEASAGDEVWAWIAVGLLAAGALVIFALSSRIVSARSRNWLAAFGVTLDTAIVFALIFLYAHEDGQPVWALYYLPILEAALRFGPVGGIVVSVALSPLLLAAEVFRAARFEDPDEVRLDVVSIRAALGVLVGAVTGRLAEALVEQAAIADARASEAERLRDALGRRVDLLEAANRCARALGSSLDVEQASSAFIRELKGLVPFDRTAIVLAEGDLAQVMATAGRGSKTVFPPGTARPIAGSVLEEVLGGNPVYRTDLRDHRYPEDELLVGVGLRSELIAPLLLGTRIVGMIAVSRTAPNGFSADERELITLLGRLVATAVQNIRQYEAERKTVDELRRLSTLRADFVSLVSHELRSPMAAVIGSARTLQQRWRQLTPEQRESFLALIGDETTRLAALIADVLDTSRIEAGTFNYTFSTVDLGQLIEESVAAAGVAQDEVAVRAEVAGPLPRVRGDRERLRQVLVNLIDNAVKYSPAGDEVQVAARAENGTLRITVQDRGPGVAREHQNLIFEKFGRAKSAGQAKPGTGLGLFIARSIAEAHGGTLDVRSSPGQGATFTLALPLD